MTTPAVELIAADTPERVAQARALFEEYAAEAGIDLSFQNFEHELATLPGEYAPPRGALLLALVDQQAAGCCALRPLDDADTPNAAEMRRLYVRRIDRKSVV